MSIHDERMPQIYDNVSIMNWITNDKILYNKALELIYDLIANYLKEKPVVCASWDTSKWLRSKGHWKVSAGNTYQNLIK